MVLLVCCIGSLCFVMYRSITRLLNTGSFADSFRNGGGKNVLNNPSVPNYPSSQIGKNKEIQQLSFYSYSIVTSLYVMIRLLKIRRVVKKTNLLSNSYKDDAILVVLFLRSVCIRKDIIHLEVD